MTIDYSFHDNCQQQWRLRDSKISTSSTSLHIFIAEMSISERQCSLGLSQWADDVLCGFSECLCFNCPFRIQMCRCIYTDTYIHVYLAANDFDCYCHWHSCDQAALWMVQSVRLSVSVCLSVTPFWLSSHHRTIMKFSEVITNDRSDVRANGQGQRSKVNVTEVKIQNRNSSLNSHMIMIWCTKLDVT